MLKHFRQKKKTSTVNVLVSIKRYKALVIESTELSGEFSGLISGICLGKEVGEGKDGRNPNLDLNLDPPN